MRLPAEQVEVPVSDILFSQANLKDSFRDGRSMQLLIDDVIHTLTISHNYMFRNMNISENTEGRRTAVCTLKEY